MTEAETPAAKPNSALGRFIPILSWLPKYDRDWLTFDVIAGLTLWGLVVPEGMAYAGMHRGLRASMAQPAGRNGAAASSSAGNTVDYLNKDPS